MPGIFGVVSIDTSRKVTAEAANAMLDHMETTLMHATDYSRERWESEDVSAYFGVVGHHSMMNTKCSATDSNRSASSVGIAYGRPVSATRQPTSLCGVLDPSVQTLEDVGGNFSIAFRERDGGIVVAVDRCAAEPLYYTEYNGLLIFAPEVKTLLIARGDNGAIDDAAVAMFLGSGHLLADQTLFAAIRKLPGGHALNVEDGRLRVHEYWRFAPGANVGGSSIDDLRDELGNIVSRSVAYSLGDSQSTVIFLSGGIDSRAIFGGCLEATGNDGRSLRTVSWGTGSPARNSDIEIANLIAETYQLNHSVKSRSIGDYAKWFRKANVLLDGMSDMAAFHPYEYEIMKDLRTNGCERVLRGDEAFGWKEKVFDLYGAVSKVGIRTEFANISVLRDVMQTKAHRSCVDAATESIGEVYRSCTGMEANDAKDYLYFTHRLQRYLGSSAYFKQVLFEHHNPLLDSQILDFISRIPRHLRYDKRLFNESVRNRYPDLCALPFATAAGLEDWPGEMASDSPLRDYLLDELADLSSGIWSYFRHDAMTELFNSMGTRAAAPLQEPSRWRKNINKGIRGMLTVMVPRVASRAVAHRHGRRLLAHKLLMRFLVLKHWHDEFVAK